MKQKELLILPFGEYKLTDGTYTYLLIKKPCNHFGKWYHLRQYGSINTGSLSFHEYEEDYFENTYPNYKWIRLEATAHVIGLSISSKDIYRMIYPLKFVYKTSYKEWLKNVEQP